MTWSKNYIIGILIVLVAIIVGTNVYFNNKVTSLTTQLRNANSSVKVLSDSVQYTKTKYGEIASQYAELKSSHDILLNQAFYKDKEIYSLQQYTLSIKTALKGDTVYYIAMEKGDSLLHTTFYNTYKDSGASVYWSDSVMFKKVAEDNWKGTNYPSFTVLCNLTNTVGRNKDGTFYGSVESFSPILNIMDIKTIVNDKYIPEPKEKNSFAIGASLDMFTFAPGVRIRMAAWQVGGEYILFSNTTTPLVQRLRLNAYYFLF